MNKPYLKLYLRKLKKYSCLLLCLIPAFSMTACKSAKDKPPIIVDEKNIEQDTKDYTANPTEEPTPTKQEEEVISNEVISMIDSSGTTLDTRINTPVGFTRIPSVPSELTGFLRGLSLKEAGSEVLLYDGLPKEYQDGHVGIFNLDIGDRDLQQCADSIMRIYAEYYWSIEAYDKIAFHLTNGFLMEYTKWRDGNRLVVDGNDVSWNKSKEYDASYDTFNNYLMNVFIYAGTLSLSEESVPISLEELKPGDMFLEGGSPGHCVLVVDIAEDKEGNRCYLLAQGYMPAQDFHILKNPLHTEDPWYYASEITYPFKTPQWTFDEGSLVRWGDFPLNEANTTEANTSQISLLAVGDNLIHTQVIDSGKKEDGSYNFDHLYSNVKDEISEADIAIVNQETILGGSDFDYTGYPNFNSPTEIGDALINAGFDVILHATNHTMDMGLAGVENTLAFWGQHSEINVLGINNSRENREQIPIVEKNGIKLALLNYTFSLNGYSVPEDKPYLVNMLDKEQMAEDIEKAEKLADLTIVFPHWGTEYVYEPTNSQKDLTKFYYDHGVDLVIGTHPHVLEPVEWVETTENKRMLVYYSLGNFMSYQKEAPRMLGGMANITITKDNTGTYISEASITPIITHYENGPVDYHYAIYKLDDYNEELAKIHGVSEIAKNGALTYQDTYDLATKVLNPWYR